MVHIAACYTCTLALTVASTAFAAHLANGVYRIIYTPPQSEDRDSPPHYLTLASPKMDATFSPVLMRGVGEKAQWVRTFLVHSVQMLSLSPILDSGT